MQIKVTVELLPHTCQNDHHQKWKQSWIEYGKGTPPTLLLGMSTGKATMENGMEVPRTTKKVELP